MPAKLASRSSRTAARVSPLALTSDSPLVYVRRMVGMRTETAIGVSSDEIGSGEGGVGRLDGGRGADPVGDRVERLEAMAGVDDHCLEGGVELAGFDELLQHADGGAAGSLGEDALGAGEQHDALA